MRCFTMKKTLFLEGKHILNSIIMNGDDVLPDGSAPDHPISTPQGIDNVANFASTPSFIPIIGAMKLTGTNKNGLTVGLMESVTARTFAQTARDGARSEEMTEPLTITRWPACRKTGMETPCLGC